MNRQREIDLPPDIGRPARRALMDAGYRRLEQIAALRVSEVGELHGVGPKAIGRLRRALAARGLSFADEGDAGGTGEQELRELVGERIAAVRAKDPAPLAARQDPDVVIFDVLPPLRSRSGDAVAEKTRAWFDSYAGDIGYEVHDLRVAADGDVGFCSFLYHVSGTLVGGDDVDMWVRATLCCRRREGRWLITHDHESVPFDPASGRALIGPSP